jgi:hypothetical protein
MNSHRTKKEKNATCWTCPNQVTTFHSTIMKGKGLKWVLMAEGKEKRDLEMESSSNAMAPFTCMG